MQGHEAMSHLAGDHVKVRASYLVMAELSPLKIQRLGLCPPEPHSVTDLTDRVLEEVTMKKWGLS